MWFYQTPLTQKTKTLEQQYPSQLLERAVGEFSRLPGIGRKTALRLVLHLLRQEPEASESFASAIVRLRNEVRYCKVCHNISDAEVCPICSSPKRDATTICVVENIQDVMAVERTGQYFGLYHVLGGVISPMDGIGPEDINLKSLIVRLQQNDVKEVVLATNPNIEGEATAMYIARLIKPSGIKVSRIAHGIPVGGDLEYADEITLLKALEGRREL